MGLNTVAFLLNDLFGELKKAPKTVNWLLQNPPHSFRHPAQGLYHVSKSFGEDLINSQAIQVLPTFHSSEFKFLLAGGNQITELDVFGFAPRKVTGQTEQTVLLKLPSWWRTDKDR